MNAERLVYMANQIGKFFAAQGEDEAASGTLDHLKKYWEPRMRAQIVAHLRAGGAGLAPHVRKAVEQLEEEEKAKA